VSLLVLNDSRVLLGTREGIGSGVLPFLEKSLCLKLGRASLQRLGDS
jgi:hypothetical protein